MMGINSLYVKPFTTYGTLMRPMDAALLKKWGPFTLGCVKRHENAVQREHWFQSSYVKFLTFSVLLFFFVFFRNCLRDPEDIYSVMNITYNKEECFYVNVQSAIPARFLQII